MKRGEVWWINFDPAVGGEVRKVRPAIILSNNASNASLNRVQFVWSLAFLYWQLPSLLISGWIYLHFNLTEISGQRCK